MPRILLITSVLPWPLRRNGGAQRTALLRDALAKHGDVDVLGVGEAAIRPPASDDAAAFERQLSQQRVAGVIVVDPPAPASKWPGLVGSLQRVVRRYNSRYEPVPAAVAKLDGLIASRGYDLIVSRYLAPAMNVDLARYPAIPKLLDFDDVDYATLADTIRANPWPGLGGWLGSRFVLRRVAQRCADGLRMFDEVFVTSDEDRELVTRTRASILPNIPFSDSPTWIEALPDTPASREALFVGDLQFPPNRDGLDHFVSAIWPVVKRQVPDAALRIVGRGLSEADRLRWGNVAGVEVVGFAEDLQACYRRAAFSVVPIYYGGGTKIKVLESLAFGRCVVATPTAMRGYLTLRDVVSVAGDDHAFAAACVKLFAAGASRQDSSARGRTALEASFSPSRFQSIVDAAIQRTLRL